MDPVHAGFRATAVDVDLFTHALSLFPGCLVLPEEVRGREKDVD